MVALEALPVSAPTNVVAVRIPVVASFDSAIAAEALMSASTITPAAIEVALPVEVTSPVKLALVVTLDAVPVSAPTNVVAVTIPLTFIPAALKLIVVDIPELVTCERRSSAIRV